MPIHRFSYAGTLGAACCAFAALWVIGLLFCHSTDLGHMLAVRSGNYGDPYGELVKHGLNRPGALRFTFAMVVVQLALAGVLIWTGIALLHSWPSARWCVLAFGVFAIAAALADTLARLLWLTLPGELIKVSPLVMDALVILFAVNLQGAVLSPRMRSQLHDQTGTLERA